MRKVAVLLVVMLSACGTSAGSDTATTATVTVTTTEAVTTTRFALAKSLAEARSRGYRFVDSMLGESYADDERKIDYFESDDCSATIDILDDMTEIGGGDPELGPGPWTWQCFPNPNPTTSTP